jgi:hypothetical protein
MGGPGSVIGWKLDRRQREELLRQFPPRYADPIADHVTLRSNSGGDPLPGPVEAQIVGRADDGDSLEAMVVTVNGTCDRPDGSIYHITWSLDEAKGRRAKESNELLKRGGWQEFDEPITVKVDPARFP